MTVTAGNLSIPNFQFQSFITVSKVNCRGEIFLISSQTQVESIKVLFIFNFKKILGTILEAGKHERVRERGKEREVSLLVDVIGTTRHVGFGKVSCGVGW